MEVISTNQAWLGSFLDRYERKKLHLGAHQEIRGDVWLPRQKDDWWDNTIVPAYEKGFEAGRTPTIGGQIVTYELSNDKDKLKYLNDGANRTIHSLIWLRNKYSKSKGKREYFDKVVSNTQISNQHRLYDDDPEAVNDFIVMNSKGTAATPYEILQSKFVANLPDYSTIWEPIFDKIQSCVSKNLLVLGYDSSSQKREAKHKWKRDNLAHFVRFANEDTTKWSPCVTNKLIDKPEHHEVEECCLQLLLRDGSESILEKIDLFDKFLSGRVNLYKQIKQEQKLQNLKVGTETTIRWWIAFAIYHFNNNFKLDTLRLFTERYFSLHHGKTTLIYKTKSGENTNTNAQLQKVSSIGTVYVALGLKPDEVEIRGPKRKKNSRCVAGYADSHVKAHCVNGNGETLPENKLENAHRSARDMTDAEYERVKKANDVE